MRPQARVEGSRLPEFARKALAVERVSRLIQTHFGGDGASVEAIDPFYVRLKGPDACLVGHRVRWRGGGPDAVPKYITVWAAPSSRIAAEARRVISTAPGEPSARDRRRVVEDGSLLLIAFPLDRQLRQLPRLLDAHRARRLLFAAVPAVFWPGLRMRRRASRVETVRYKPERRAVLRWDLSLADDATGSRSSKSLFVRLHDRPLAPAAEAALWSVRLVSDGELFCPQVFATPHQRLSIESSVGGSPLPMQRAAGAIDRVVSTTIDRAGRALAHVHAQASIPDPLGQWTPQDELAEVARCLDDLEQTMPELASRGRRVLDLLESHAPEQIPGRLLHGDFHVGQLLSRDVGVGIVDFDRTRVGDPAYDVAAFRAHLRLEDQDEQLGDMLLAGYEGIREPPRAVDIAWYESCALLRLSGIPLRYARPSWPGDAGRLIAAAETVGGACTSSPSRPTIAGSSVTAPDPPPAAVWVARLRDRLAMMDVGPSDAAVDAQASETLVLEGLRSGGASAIVRTPKGRQRETLVMRVVAGPDGDVLGDPVSMTLEEDEGLPGARTLTDRNQLELCLAPHLDIIERVELLSHHPERRAVLRVSGRSASRERTLYVKLLRRSRYSAAVSLLRGLSPGGTRLRPALPLLELDDACALVLPEVPGVSLYELLVRGRLPEARSLAGPLSELAAISLPAGAPCRSLQAEVASSRRMLELSIALNESLRPLLARLDAIGPVGESCTPRQLGTVHGDLHDKQIFIDGDTVHLIDVEGLSFGDPLMDAVNLAEHLRLRSRQGLAGRGAARLSGELMQLAIGSSPAEAAGRTSLLRGLVLARLAGVYSRRPGTRSLVDELVREASLFLELAS